MRLGAPYTAGIVYIRANEGTEPAQALAMEGGNHFAVESINHGEWDSRLASWSQGFDHRKPFASDPT